MGTVRYTFKHDGKTFEAIGTFGHGDQELFIVTVIPKERQRTLGVPSAPPPPVGIKNVIQADDENELLEELKRRYPGLTDFKNN